MDKKNITGVVTLLAPYIFSFAFAMDVYVPSVPQIMRELHASKNSIQVTLSIFIFVVGLGQLLIGPFSDQIGRRTIGLLSAMIFAFGSLLCAVASDVQFLIIARVIEAIGGCGMMVIPMAMVRDMFAENEAAKVYSFLNCGIAMSPLFAPIIGSYLAEWFGWRAGFVFLLILGLIAFTIGFFKFDETLPAENRMRLSRDIFKCYWIIMRNAEFLTFSLIGLSAISVFFTFFSVSPYIIINVLHTPVQHFGFYFFLVGLTFFIGSLISGKLVEQVGVFKTITLGVIILFISSLWMLFWYLLFGLSLAEFIMPSMLAVFGGAFMMGACAGGAMQPFAHMVGSAAAALGAIEFVGAAIVGNITMLWKVQSTMSYNIAMLAVASVSILALLFYKLTVSRKHAEN